MKLSTSSSINRALYSIGVFDYLSALEHLPSKYIDMTPSIEGSFTNKEKLILRGYIISEVKEANFARGTIQHFDFRSEATNRIYHVDAFNHAFLKKFDRNNKYNLLGIYKNGRILLVNLLKAIEDNLNKPRPIYSLPNSIDNTYYKNLVAKSFKELNGTIKDNVPAYFMKKWKLLPRETAFKLAHNPNNMEDVKKGLRVLKYEECLKFTLKTELIREENKKLSKDIKQHISIKQVEEFIATLPYKLTNSQIDAVTEILFDMNKTNLMYRLLQGDVGSGKTLVAALALYGNTLRGDQGALMAPTDALARQHFITLRKLFENTNLRIALLVGATPKKERDAIELALINHRIDIVVGTHTLFSERVNYSSLGLAVIDEQHRFGVNQRLLLASKGSHADLLLMSATPIPRTLALTIYGDLDVSTLKEFPFDNKNISTQILKSNDKTIYEQIQKSIDNNKRVYIIAPLIDDEENKRFSAEQLFAHFLLKFKGKVGLLHGKLSDEEKEFALLNFKNGKYPILVSTTVIEVGIDIKEADLMIIYEANNFGLASLHQLRGRIGRDGSPANCYLIYDDDDENDFDRLKVLVNSNDGFYIASEDLKRRGPGQLGGYKQSGLPEFKYVNIIDDFRMFECAREDAKFIIFNRVEPGFRKILSLALKEINNHNFTNV